MQCVAPHPPGGPHPQGGPSAQGTSTLPCARRGAAVLHGPALAARLRAKRREGGGGKGLNEWSEPKQQAAASRPVGWLVRCLLALLSVCAPRPAPHYPVPRSLAAD